MAEVFFTLSDGSPRAVVGVRRKNNGTVQTLDESVPDGDTVGTHLLASGSVRFLGIDSPEKSFEQQLGLKVGSRIIHQGSGFSPGQRRNGSSTAKTNGNSNGNGNGHSNTCGLRKLKDPDAAPAGIGALERQTANLWTQGRVTGYSRPTSGRC